MKKPKLILLAILVPAVMVSFASNPGKKEFVLKYNVPAGQSFTLTSQSTNNMTTEQMGQSISVDMAASGETVYRALAAQPDGSMQYEMEFKARTASAKSEMGGGDTDFSTWIGKKMNFNLSPLGEVSGFKGFEQLPEISGATGEKMNGDQISKTLGQQFMRVPDHAIKLKESWNTKDSTEVPYAGSKLTNVSDTKYTAKEVTKLDGMECLVIEYTESAKLTGTFEQQGMEIELTRQTTATGTILFALEKGMFVSMDGNSVSNSQIYVSAAGMTIPQEMKGKSSIKVVFDK